MSDRLDSEQRLAILEEHRAFKRSELRRAQELSGEFAGMVPAVAVDSLSVWAVRYALGRMTYAVNDVVDTLIACRHALTDKSRAAIIRAIEEGFEAGRFGTLNDKRKWTELLETLSG